MPLEDLSADELQEAIKDTRRLLKTLEEHQKTLATGAGLPKDQRSRVEFMMSNVKMAEGLVKRLQKMQRRFFGGA